MKENFFSFDEIGGDYALLKEELRRGTPTAKQPVQKGKMSPRKKAAFAKKRNGK